MMKFIVLDNSGGSAMTDKEKAWRQLPGVQQPHRCMGASD